MWFNRLGKRKGRLTTNSGEGLEEVGHAVAEATTFLVRWWCGDTVLGSLDAVEKDGVALEKSARPTCSGLLLTGANTTTQQSDKNPGTIIGSDVLLVLMTPTARCALKIHASDAKMSTMVRIDTFASVLGVRVASIWRTRRTSTMSCEMVA